MEKERPLVSVVIVVKNGERFIRNALESVFAQHYQNFEVIVVDGRSDDHTLSIVHEYNPAQVIIQNDTGIADAYNVGIQAARAEFISFLSSDDIWLPEKLSSQIHFMLNHPDVLFTNSLVEFFLEPGDPIPADFRKELLVGSHPARIMENLVARRQVFEKVGLFNTDLRTAEDVDWYSRAHYLHISSFTIEKVLLKKRIHNSNSSINAEMNNKNLMIVLQKAIQRKREARDQIYNWGG